MTFEIIDADGHINESFERLSRYLEAPFNKRPLNADVPWYPMDGWDRRLYGSIQGLARNTEEWSVALSHGMSAAVLFPTISLQMAFLRDADWAVALSRAYNTLLYTEFTSRDSRLKGVALLPLQDPAASVKELQRAHSEFGFVAAMLPADGYFLLGHARFDALYAEAERLGVALCVHASGSDIGGSYSEPFPKFIQAHVVSHVVGQMRQFSSILFEGVPERFPKLRIAFLEAGAGWVPFLVSRMDGEYAIRGSFEAKSLKRPPSAVLRDGNLFFSCEADEPLLAQAVECVGSTQLLFASDFPHWDKQFPASIRTLSDRRDLSDEVKAKIFAHNAKRLYGLV